MRKLRWLVLPTLLLLAACGTPPPSGEEPPKFPNASGTWEGSSTFAVCGSALIYELRLSMEQDGGVVTGYVALSISGRDEEVYAAFDGHVTEEGEVSGTVLLPTGPGDNSALDADLVLAGGRLFGSLTTASLSYCGEDAPERARLQVDLPQTADGYTEPATFPDLSGAWTASAAEVNECGVMHATDVTLNLDQGRLGTLSGHVELTLAAPPADLPRFAIATGYLTPQGTGLLGLSAGNVSGSVDLRMRDDGVMEAELRYAVNTCAVTLVEAELAR